VSRRPHVATPIIWRVPDECAQHSHLCNLPRPRPRRRGLGQPTGKRAKQYERDRSRPFMTFSAPGFRALSDERLAFGSYPMQHHVVQHHVVYHQVEKSSLETMGREGSWLVGTVSPAPPSCPFPQIDTPMMFRQCDFFALLEIARLTPGGPLCRLAAMTKISATAAKDTARRRKMRRSWARRRNSWHQTCIAEACSGD
jgi:hypothetical protein